MGKAFSEWAARSAIVSGLALAVLSAYAADPQVEGEAPGVAEARATIEPLAKGGALKLSTKLDSATDTFQFLFTLERLVADRMVGLTWHVVRSGPKLAIMVRPGGDMSTLPVLYITNGRLVSVDSLHPGGLIYIEGCNPRLILDATDGRLGFDWHVVSGKDEPATAVADAGQMAAELLDHAERAQTDKEKGLVTIRRKGGTDFTITITPAGKVKDHGTVGLQGIYSKSGSSVFRFTIGPPLQPDKADYFNVTRDAVLKLGLPVRIDDREHASVSEPEVARIVMPGPEVLDDPRARAAAEKLESLFLPAPAASKKQG